MLCVCVAVCRPHLSVHLCDRCTPTNLTLPCVCVDPIVCVCTCATDVHLLLAPCAGGPRGNSHGRSSRGSRKVRHSSRTQQQPFPALPAAVIAAATSRRELTVSNEAVIEARSACSTAVLLLTSGAPFALSILSSPRLPPPTHIHTHAHPPSLSAGWTAAVLATAP